MAEICPITITRPLRNKVCVFPEKETCNLTSSDVNGIIRRNPFSYYNVMYKPYIKRLEDEKKFNAIKRQFQKFKRKKIIEEDENPGFYIYNIIDGNQQFTGVLGKINFNQVEKGKVKSVEEGLKFDMNYLAKQYETIGFIPRPFNVVYPEHKGIQQIINKYKTHIPLFEFTKSNGIIHEVWKVLDPVDIDKFEKYFNEISPMLLMDNGNDFEAYYQVYQSKKKNKLWSGNEAFNFFPAFLISKTQVNIYEYKKGISSKAKIDFDQLLNKIKNNFYIQEINHTNSPKKGEILLFTLQKKYKLQLKHKFDNFLPDSLIFKKYILPEIESLIPEIRLNNLKFCSGDRSVKCVENQLSKGNCNIGIVVAASNYEQINYAIQNNYKLPVFGVYLQPRLLKGLFIYEF